MPTPDSNHETSRLDLTVSGHVKRGGIEGVLRFYKASLDLLIMSAEKLVSVSITTHQTPRPSRHEVA